MTIEYNAELLPCPFCGAPPSTELSVNDYAHAYIKCKACKYNMCVSHKIETYKDFQSAFTSEHGTKKAVKDVIEKWNTRA